MQQQLELFPENRIMDLDHPEWDIFADCMMDLESCERIKVASKRELFCDDTHRLTRMVLRSFPNVDVEGSIELFKKHGGFCDCEVAMNAICSMEDGVDPDAIKAEIDEHWKKIGWTKEKTIEKAKALGLI